jgi:hypothetical protein
MQVKPWERLAPGLQRRRGFSPDLSGQRRLIIPRVTADGEPVDDLRPEQVTLLVDGRPRPIVFSVTTQERLE